MAPLPFIPFTLSFPRVQSMRECPIVTTYGVQEHENALKFFQRALQLDPSFTYAYTLAGHEYFANEDFDKGLQCYRNAMRLDPRHYNAW